MSRKCDHDWFDHYMMYTALSNGSGDWGCLIFMLEVAAGALAMAFITYFIAMLFGAV